MKPEDPIDVWWARHGFDPDDCTVEEDGPLGQVCDASKHTRSEALTMGADALGVCRKDVRCSVRWARAITRQEQWEADDGGGRFNEEWGWADSHEPELHYRERETESGGYGWLDSNGMEYESPVPVPVPDGWDAGEPPAVWWFCDRNDQGAVKVFFCEEREP